MLTLKILSADDAPDYRLISDVREVRFKRSRSTKFDRTQLGLPEAPWGKVQTVCVAICERATGASASYLLTGQCYVLNEEGKTVDSYHPNNQVVDDDAGAPNQVIPH